MTEYEALRKERDEARSEVQSFRNALAHEREVASGQIQKAQTETAFWRSHVITLKGLLWLADSFMCGSSKDYGGGEFRRKIQEALMAVSPLRINYEEPTK